MTVTAMHELQELDDKAFYDFVSHRFHEDYDHLWDNYLLKPHMVFRVLGVMQRARDLIGNGAANLESKETSLNASRVSGGISEEQFLLALKDLKDQKRKLVRFKSLQSARYRQVRSAANALKDKKRNQSETDREARRIAHEERQRAGETFHRVTLAKVACAIDAHREAMWDEDYKPTEHDLKLWSVLDSVEVPYRAGMAPMVELIENGAWGSSSEDEEDEK